MAKRMLEDNALSLKKIAEYSGLELEEILDLQMGMQKIKTIFQLIFFET